MSGNGVHVWQPVEAIVLEQESKFAQFDQPSQTFLKFAAQFLSNHKSDINNNPAFKSCLIRIPGSYNSKYIEQNKEVKVIQRWDGYRPKANPLYYIFIFTSQTESLENSTICERHIRKVTILSKAVHFHGWRNYCRLQLMIIERMLLTLSWHLILSTLKNYPMMQH